MLQFGRLYDKFVALAQGTGRDVLLVTFALGLCVGLAAMAIIACCTNIGVPEELLETMRRMEQQEKVRQTKASEQSKQASMSKKHD